MCRKKLALSRFAGQATSAAERLESRKAGTAKESCKKNPKKVKKIDEKRKLLCYNDNVIIKRSKTL